MHWPGPVQTPDAIDAAPDAPAGPGTGTGTGYRRSPKPARSANTCTVPELPLKIVTVPSDPTLVRTRFGTVCPATKLRFDVGGGEALPAAYTFKIPEAVGCVTVT